MPSKKRIVGPAKLAQKYRVPSAFTVDAIEEFLFSLDCPRALTVWILFTNNEHGQIAELEFDPGKYFTTAHLRDSYAATKLLAKYKDFSLDVDLEAVALEKFRSYELLCAETNRRFRDLGRDPLFTGATVWLHNAVKRKISEILEQPDLEDFFNLASWGPGASTLIKRRDASSANKFQQEVGITRELYDILCPGGSLKILREYSPRWSELLCSAGFPLFQKGNKVITVPKDATTDRPIAIEPGLNLWFQKALGQMFRQKLRKRGVRIDLRWQSRNQKLAEEGSKNLFCATVDFSSASDSIASGVVEELIPVEWYRLLDLTRSRYGSLKEETFRWNKFSSMGNGFTFELETLIFYAIALCCVEYRYLTSASRGDLREAKRVVSAYGDDVILPVDCLELFRSVCTFYGFRLNAKKTHAYTAFRESCGAHFYGGIDVKPIFLKQKMTTIQSVYRFANAVRRMAHRRGNYSACDSAFRTLFDHLVQRTPKVLRLRVPEGFGDGGFISNLDEASPSRLKHGVEGYRVIHLVERDKTREVEYDGLLLARLKSLSSQSHGVPCRFSPYHPWLTSLTALSYVDIALGNKVGAGLGQLVNLSKKGHVSQWYNLGAWE